MTLRGRNIYISQQEQKKLKSDYQRILLMGMREGPAWGPVGGGGRGGGGGLRYVWHRSESREWSSIDT